MNRNKDISGDSWSIRAASLSDIVALTQLTFRSKSHWGYSSDQMDQWKEELTIDQKYLQSYLVYVLFQGEKHIGYYSLAKSEGPNLQLDNLFIDPSEIGNGWGRLLLKDLIKRCEKGPYKTIELLSDPNAKDFYIKNGFEQVGSEQSSIPGRSLPIMRYIL